MAQSIHATSPRGTQIAAGQEQPNIQRKVGPLVMQSGPQSQGVTCSSKRGSVLSLSDQEILDTKSKDALAASLAT